MKAWCLNALLLSRILPWNCFGCPNCNIYNHLENAVQTAEFTGVGSVIDLPADQQTVTVLVKEVLSGKQPLLKEVSCENNLRQHLTAGDQVAVIGANMNLVLGPRPVILPFSMVPELRLLLKDVPAENAADAARQITSVSSHLHWRGASYYKAFPHAVQNRLKAQILSFQFFPGTTLSHEKEQYLFGIAAVMRGPVEGAEELAIQIMDEFWHLPPAGRSAQEIQWTLTKLSAVFDMAAVLDSHPAGRCCTRFIQRTERSRHRCPGKEAGWRIVFRGRPVAILGGDT